MLLRELVVWFKPSFTGRRNLCNYVSSRKCYRLGLYQFSMYVVQRSFKNKASVCTSFFPFKVRFIEQIAHSTSSFLGQIKYKDPLVYHFYCDFLHTIIFICWHFIYVATIYVSVVTDCILFDLAVCLRSLSESGFSIVYWSKLSCSLSIFGQSLFHPGHSYSTQPVY